LEKISIEELTVARIDIEKAVLVHAIKNADEADIESLQQNISDTKQKIEANINSIDENIQFHNLVAKASKNQFFVIVVEALTMAVRHFMSQIGPESQDSNNHERFNESILKSKNTLSYHTDILAAIIAKNQPGAVDLIETHLLEVKERLEVFADQPHTVGPDRV